jgi:glycosyltransferase involved in cell wall biosynthesis
MKLTIITCSSTPDYIRAVTLRQAALDNTDRIDNLDVNIIKNKRLGISKYFEMSLRIIWLRLRYNPDVYLLTFRGYEMLPLTKLVSFKKKLIFDEFVNPIEWLNEPRDILWAKLIPKKLFRIYYRRLVKSIDIILADTEAHARYSAKLSKLPVDRYRSLPVGTDEHLFYPDSKAKKLRTFSVFYYGQKMLPLHGLSTVLKAVELLKDYPIQFLFLGGGDKTNKLVKQQNNPRLAHKNWVAFEALPYTIRKHHLALGGPFGKTTQADLVITGKTYQFLACSVPTIIGKNKVSGIFKDRINSLVVEQKDARQLADKILWAYKNQTELKKIGHDGRRLYETEFSSAVIADSFGKILHDLH